ncbi:MAG: ABC transporter ATP-binding protein [Armatimonadetes bacterium]|nr:ABC transporter ATP-binding protein [Armatimonadota bacterium]
MHERQMTLPIPESPLLRVQDLAVEFTVGGRRARAVDRLSYELRPGEVLGMVGESGCGKSVSALALMRLVPEPGQIAGGEVWFDGRNLLSLPEREMRPLRGGQIAMIFQDPLSALNPVLTVGFQVMEAIALHQRVPRKVAWERAVEMLRRVHLPDAEHRARFYPHQLSGGQRQRVMIAIAFSCSPRLVIADEPTTALDVTVQQQVLELMLELRQEFGTAILLITHDLGVVAQTCDRVLVMYAGRAVEVGSVRAIFHTPRHPYTAALLRSLPRLEGKRSDRLALIPGQPPDIFTLPTGCPFHPRCPLADDRCAAEMPPWTDFSSAHGSRCWHAGDVTLAK